MKKLPIGTQDFRKIREQNQLYVDKTELIAQLISDGSYYFLSRPRRFGKSLLVNTLKAIFEGQKELFKGLWIEDQYDFDQQFPVIYLPFAAMGYKGLGLEQAIQKQLNEIAQEHELLLDLTTPDQMFKALIKGLYQKYGQSVVILIDEYDKPIIDFLGKDIEQAVVNQQIMKNFYSVVKDMDAYIRFFFITGVSKFSKVSVFSDLNNLWDLTLDNRFGSLCGITQVELEANFEPYIDVLTKQEQLSRKDLLLKIQSWYNGYSFNAKDRVYNPFSLLSLFVGMRFSNYWFSTGTPTFLIDLIRKETLYDLDGVKAGEAVFDHFDIEEIDIVSLLFQTGYLTIKEKDHRGLYTMAYPNKEVRESFLNYLIEGFSKLQKTRVQPLIFTLEDAFAANDIETVVLHINTLLAGLPYQLHEQTEKFYHAVIHLLFSYLGIYIQSEVCTSLGRSDAIVQTDTHIYCLEFKLDRSADVALQQINDKGYLKTYAKSPKTKVAVGINLSSKTKGIDDWKLEGE